MKIKGALGKRLHWSCLDTCGEIQLFRTHREVSDFAVKEWGCKPLSSEQVSRICRLFQQGRVKESTPVFYRYHMLNLQRVSMDPPT